MKKTNLLLLACVIGVFILLVWLIHNHKSREVQFENETSAVFHTNDNTQPTQNFKGAAIKKIHELNPNSPEEVKAWLAESVKKEQAMKEHINDDWKTPIEFYGRVLDESNNAVASTTIDYSCNDTSVAGTSYYHTTSDANGFFSFKGIQGKLLEVDVSKKGYYTYDPHGQFFYYAGENQNFIPNAANPVIFRLKKKGDGVDLIKADYPAFAHITQLKHDETPVELDLLNGTIGAGQLKLEFQRDLTEKNPRLFNWKLQMTMPGGGFTGTDEMFPFKASEGDYKSDLIFDMATNSLGWRGEIHTNFYFRLSDGKYGRMSFEFLGWNGVYTIHSLVNPDGSRNLESK